MSPHYMARYRATDGPRKGKFWVFLRRCYLVWVAAVPAIAVIAALVAVLEVQDQVDQIAEIQAEQLAEGEERRDQTCAAFERDAIIAARFYRDARRAYRNSIQFLRGLPPEEADTFLIRAVRDRIPRLRREVHQRFAEAEATAAPPFCDEPRVGLPEPNPRLPDQALP